MDNDEALGRYVVSLVVHGYLWDPGWQLINRRRGFNRWVDLFVASRVF